MKNYKMQEGSHLGRSPNKPILSVIYGPSGSIPYLWVGNSAEGDTACFATISGKRKLRQIALAIIRATAS